MHSFMTIIIETYQVL